MSILIKGMEIPKNCGDCPCAHIFEGYKCMAVERSFDKYPLENREDWCPLIEVPEPHGRLGDLDALMLIIREYIDEYGELDENGFHSEKWCAMKEAEMVICEAPTIVPASEEG